MRKLFLFMMVSLDGFFEGSNHDISWHNVDGEFNDFAVEQLHEVDTLLFGRKTYELMVSYWPTKAAKRDDPIIAELMNTMPKIVISKTRKNAKWENTRLISKNVAEEVLKLKKQKEDLPSQRFGESKKDIAIFGSNNLCVSLLEMGLLDEVRVIINPVVIGHGTLLFKGIKDKLDLKHFRTKTFKSGNVLLYYRLDKKVKAK